MVQFNSQASQRRQHVGMPEGFGIGLVLFDALLQHRPGGLGVRLVEGMERLLDEVDHGVDLVISVVVRRFRDDLVGPWAPAPDLLFDPV